jgi:hypothetical protein
LRRRDSRRIRYERHKHSSLVPTGLPQSDGKLVISTGSPGQLSDLRDRNAEYLAAHDAVSRHSIAIAPAAAPLEPGECL